MDRRFLAVIACIFVTCSCFGASDIQQRENDVKFGEALFHDTSLSADGHVSCASCHQPQHAFSDDKALATGVFGRVGSRHAPSLLNIGSSHVFFWDGRRTRLNDVVLDPFFITEEMGLHDENELVERVREAGYAQRFAELFPDASHISMDRIQAALVAYVRSLSIEPTLYRQPSSTWHLRGPAKQGMEVFFGKAQCSACHTVSAENGRFTDDLFHPSALGTQSIAPKLSSLITSYLAKPTSGRSLGELVTQHKDLAELGHFLVSDSPTDINTFRTPSLLNVADTAPYMHDGSVSTMEKAVDLEIYYRSLQLGRPVHLTAEEREDLLAFLKTLRNH